MKFGFWALNSLWFIHRRKLCCMLISIKLTNNWQVLLLIRVESHVLTLKCYLQLLEADGLRIVTGNKHSDPIVWLDRLAAIFRSVFSELFAINCNHYECNSSSSFFPCSALVARCIFDTSFDYETVLMSAPLKIISIRYGRTIFLKCIGWLIYNNFADLFCQVHNSANDVSWWCSSMPRSHSSGLLVFFLAYL